jgi:DNA replication protein DnaC
MTTLERLRTTLTGLSLTAIDARLETLLENAAKKEPAYADFLLEVMSTEADARRQRYLKTRLQLAHLPYVKTFDQFDFAFQPSIDERQVRELRTLRFVHEASNVILLGPPGVGKTHLAVALAETAIQSGQAAYFMTAHDLVADLGRRTAKAASTGACESISRPRSSSSMKWGICRWMNSAPRSSFNWSAPDTKGAASF